MKRSITGLLAATALVGAGGCALAQPAAQPTAGGASAAASKLTLDSPIEQIAAKPEGKAILDRVMPGLTSHPMYNQFKPYSLKALQPLSGGQVTDDGLKQVAAELEKLP